MTSQLQFTQEIAVGDDITPNMSLSMLAHEQIATNQDPSNKNMITRRDSFSQLAISPTESSYHIVSSPSSIQTWTMETRSLSSFTLDGIEGEPESPLTMVNAEEADEAMEKKESLLLDVMLTLVISHAWMLF